MERVGDRQEKMEGYCSTGQSPLRTVQPMEEYVCKNMNDTSNKVLFDVVCVTVRRI